jgi:decaprenyl-phosphate phosphoribosyltransferase
LDTTPVEHGGVPEAAPSRRSFRRAGARAASVRPRRPTAALIVACRPKQWIKNLLVFAAPAAAGVIRDDEVLARASLAFVAFCLVSSAMYLVNDLVDREHDARHPTKRLRPIASGEVTARAAAITSAVLLSAGAAAAAVLGWRFAAAVGAYVALTVSYSLWLKTVAVVDIGAVALGFVVRAVAGGLATGVSASQWFLILTSFVSLFVVAGKRYADMALEEPVAAGRGPIAYTPGYLRFVWTMSAAVTVAAYCLWAFSSPQAVQAPGWAQISAIPFVLAILRYALVLESGRAGAPEEILLTDRPLQILTIAWLAAYAVGVYGGR